MEPSKSLLARLLTMPDDDQSIGFSYDEAKSLARHPDPEVRCSLAARDDVVPEVLYFLASDPNPNVRRNLAANTSAPRQADYLLSDDADINVRTDLARKIARLSPGLSPEEHDKIQHVTYLTLEKLTYDQMPIVRFAISDTIKKMPDVPRSIVQRLAQDLDIIVAAPVLEFSPILTDDDLLSIINANPVTGALNAISRRRNLSAIVAHGIAVSHDADAIVTLLENDSAQIREDTLDLLIEQSKTDICLQSPLVRRPDLSPDTARRLAEFVTEHVLHALAKRDNLPQETLEAIDKAVRKRLATLPTHNSPSQTKELIAIESQMGRAERLHQPGHMSDALFSDAIVNHQDYIFAKALLSVCSGLAPSIVLDILNSNSPKAVIALVWAAGFGMTQAIQAQSILANIKPEYILQTKDGAFPLTEGELRTQIAMFQASNTQP